MFFCCPLFSTQFASELIDQEVHFEKAAELRREVMLFEAMFGKFWIQVGVGNVYFFRRKMFVKDGFIIVMVSWAPVGV